MVVPQPLPPDPPAQVIQAGVEILHDLQSGARKIADEAVRQAQRQSQLEADLRNRTQTQQPR